MSKVQTVQKQKQKINGFTKKNGSPIKMNGYATHEFDIDNMSNNKQASLSYDQQKTIQLSQNDLVEACFSYYVKLRQDSSAKINLQLPQKFIEIQKQIIQVVQFRKDLQKEREINNLKDQYFQIIHKLIEKNKDLQQTVDILALKIKELENQLLNAKYFPSTLTQTNQYIKADDENTIKKKRRQFKDCTNKIFAQITFIKKSIEKLATFQEKTEKIGITVNNNLAFKQNFNDSILELSRQPRQNSSSEIDQIKSCLMVQSKQLQLKLEIQQEREGIQNIYSQSQCQLIEGLINQLIQLKTEHQKYKKKFAQAMKIVKQTKFQYARLSQSEKALQHNQIFQQLIQMKQIQQEKQQKIKQLQQKINNLQQKIQKNLKLIKQKQNIIQVKQLQIREQKLKLCQQQYKFKELKQQQQNKLQQFQKQKIEIVRQLNEKIEQHKKGEGYFKGKCQLLTLANQDLRKEFTKLLNKNKELLTQKEQFQIRIQELNQTIKNNLLKSESKFDLQRKKLQQQVKRLQKQNQKVRDLLKNTSDQKTSQVQKLNSQNEALQQQLKNLKLLIKQKIDENILLQTINSQLQLEKQENLQKIQQLFQVIEQNSHLQKEKVQQLFTKLSIENQALREQKQKSSKKFKELYLRYQKSIEENIQKYDQNINEVFKYKNISCQNWTDLHKLIDDNNYNILALLEDQHNQDCQSQESKSEGEKQNKDEILS